MTNPMLIRAVAEEMALWTAAWPAARRDATAESQVQVFAEAIDGCALAAIPGAGRRLRRESKYFPTPAEFYAAVVAEEREEADRMRLAFVDTSGRRRDSRDYCPQCNTRYEWRQLLDERGEPSVLGYGPDNTPIMGERLLCDHVWQRYLERYERERAQREYEEQYPSEGAAVRPDERDRLWHSFAKHKPHGMTQPRPKVPAGPWQGLNAAVAAGADREPPPWDGPKPWDD